MRPYEKLLHRHPFVMLYTAEIIEEKVLARGTRQLTMNDPILMSS